MKVVYNKYRPVSERILASQPLNVDVEMQEFINAVNIAKNIEYPERKILYGIYDKIIERDAHLRSQLRTAHYTVQQSEFFIKQNGKETDKLKDYFEKSWFTDFITHAIDAEFWGHSLIEFENMQNGEFSAVKLIDRFHVIPEQQKVLIDINDDISAGIYYGDKLNKWFLIEAGSAKNLGLLLTASIEIIYKKNSRNDWSAFNERFGMPLLAITTDTSNPNELDALERFAENFASAGYVIGSRETQFDVKQATGTENGHNKYREFAKDADDYISKLINGQSATSDQKAFVGAAEVQERILNTYTLGRLQRIQRDINDKLIPFLVYHGYPLQNAKFQYVDLLKKKPMPTLSNNDSEKKNDKPVKKQVLSGFKNDIELLYNTDTHTHNHVQDIDTVFASNNNPLQSIFDKLIKKLHQLAGKKQVPDNILELPGANELIKETAGIYEKAIKKAFKSGFKPDEAFKNKLTQDVWIFSGFKTHRQLKDVSAMLWEGDKLKPFYRFRDDVLSIHKDYNINWLMSEYNMAANSSLQAAKWHDYEKAGDRYYLQYRTVGDERVRKSHRELNRITLPPSDQFWDSFFPPNAWGCRCTAVQVLKSRYEKSDPKTALKKGNEAMIIKYKSGEINKRATEKMNIFKYNPGKKQIVFPKNHPYYKVQERYEKIKKAAVVLRNKNIFDNYGDEYKKHYFDKNSGGFVVSHKNHGKAELAENLKIGKILANNGYAIELVATPVNKISADATLNKEICEFKTNKKPTYNAIDMAIRKGAKQAGIIALHIESDIKKGDLMNAIKDRLERSNIKRLIVVKNDKIYDYAKNKWLNNDIKIE